MFLHVDPSNGLAIYDQIVRQIKFAVAGGALPAGELAPSVRELARDLTVNPNTVARAYQQLQSEGVLETVRGLGLAVSAGADKRCRVERSKLVQTRLREVLIEGRHAGLEVAELRQLVDSELTTIDREVNKRKL